MNPANPTPAEQDDFAQLDWIKALQTGLAESDEKIRAASLHDGWAIVNHRGGVIREAMSRFYQQVIAEAPPRGTYAIHALGGTGRREICPGSDVDIGIIVENIEENEHFFRHVSHQLRKFSPYVPGLRNSVKANAFPDLKVEAHFDLTSLAALLDCDLLAGDAGLDHRIRDTCEARAAELGLEFIFAINRDLRAYDRRYPQPPGDVGGFHVKNGIGGLRNFQMTMWLYAFERWISSVQVYEKARRTRRFDSEGAPTPEVLDAAGIIFCARCWIEQWRIEHPRDADEKRLPDLFIGVTDMAAFLERFGAAGLTELNSARETISAYRHETLDRLIEHGVVVPDTDGLVVWGPHGLRVGSEALFKDATEMFYSIYRAQQRFHLPIDGTIKRAARKHISASLQPHAALIKLMVSPGTIFPALQDWNEYGILDQVIPGFGELAERLYEQRHRCAALTRAARALQRVENLEYLATLKPRDVGPLEAYFVRQYERLGDSARGALRLALLTEEIPETLYGPADDPSSVKTYVSERLAKLPGLSDPTLRTIEFLLLTKRELLRFSELSNESQVLESWRHKIARLGSRDAADTIRALALFAYAAFDFHKPPDAPSERLNATQWTSVQNLTQNLLNEELGIRGQPFVDHYFDETGRRIGNLLPRRLLASPHVDKSLQQVYDGPESLDPYRAHAIIGDLSEVAKSGRPKVEIRRHADYCRLILFAWDFPGLFWRVAGTLYERGCSVLSTDLYAIPDPNGNASDGESLIPEERRLIYDVLTFEEIEDANERWMDEVRTSILQRLERREDPIPDNTQEILAPVMSGLSPRLTDLGNGQMKFSCHSPATNKGTRYAISRILSECAGANIESIAQDGTRDWPVPRTNFYLRVSAGLHEVAAALAERLGKIETGVDTL